MKTNSRIVATACALVLVVAACSCVSGTPWIIQTQKGEASLTSVSAADPRHVWAVGGGPIYMFDGVSWTTQVEKLEEEPVEVSAADENHAWACGGDGRGIIWSYDGKTWSRQFETDDDTMSDVAAADATHAWAVGAKGNVSNIYYYDGVSWSLSESFPVHVQDIFALDVDHAWLVAENVEGRSSIVSYDRASGWRSSYQAPERHFFLGVTAISADTAWAVGTIEKIGDPRQTEGIIYHLDGGKWVLQAKTPEEMHKVAAADGEHAWAVGGLGSSGPIYFYDGRSWAKQFDAKESLFDVTCGDSGHAWAVGGLGGIFIHEESSL